MTGWAVAVQANMTRLVSGVTVILNFLKKSLPRMGPATDACKKTGSNKFALKLDSFCHESQRGDW